MNLKGLLIGLVAMSIIIPFIINDYYESLGSAYGYDPNLDNSPYDTLFNETSGLSENLRNKVKGTTGTGDIFELILGNTVNVLVLMLDLPVFLVKFIHATETTLGIPDYLIILVDILLVIAVTLILVSIIMKWRFSDD